MKKNSLIFILICIIIVFTSCSITPQYPTDGIWYNNDLKLVIDFRYDKILVFSYDENLSKLELDIWIGRDKYVDIVYYDDISNDIIEIYSGWRKYKNDEFVLTLYSKANPEDDFRTQIELDDEEFVFVRVDSYDEINELESN